MRTDGWKNSATANWTEARIAQLTDLWLAGVSCSKIALEMGGGISRNAVIGKVHRLKLPHRITKDAFKPGMVPKKTRGPDHKVRMTKPRRIALGQPLSLPKIKPAFEKPSGHAWKPLEGVEPVSLIDLEAGQCKWPVTEDSPFLFCGAASTHGRYCHHHHLWSVGQGTASEQAAIKSARSAASWENYVPSQREAA